MIREIEFELLCPSSQTMAGLALLIHDKNDAVIANIVGRVSISKITKIATHLDKFPKDLLKKLMEAGNAEKEDKSDKELEKPAAK